MAGEPQPSMIDPRPLLAAELRARADQLAEILDIPPHAYGEKVAEAYQIMGHLAAMPSVRDHGRRRDYGNEIKANASRVFSPFSAEGNQFFNYLQARVVIMQEIPDWFHNQTDSDEKLVNDYRLVKKILDAMKVAGFSELGGSGAAAI